MTLVLLLGGCGGSAGSDYLTLSEDEVEPGAFVTIAQASLAAGQEVQVQFTQPNGGVVSVAARARSAGSVRVSVPPVIDAATHLPVAGTLTVGLEGKSAEQTLRVRGLPDTGDVTPGAIVQAVLESQIEDYQSIADNLRDPAGSLAILPGAAEAVAEVDAQIAALQAMVDELGESGTLTVSLAAGGTATYRGEQLRLMDGWLAAMLRGLEAETAAAGPSGRVLQARDCFANLPANYTGDQYVACTRAAIRNVRQEATWAANGFGGLIASGAGMIIFIGGLATGASEAVLVTGAVVSVIGCVQGFIAATAAQQNTDALMGGKGGKFSASGEVLSQAGRYAAGVVSAPISTALTIKDLNASAATVRCRNPDAQRALEDDFCTSCDCDPDAGVLDLCADTCIYAGDGECDDGGAGSMYSVCSLGTDCSDCGGRSDDPDDGGGGVTDPDPDPDPASNAPNGCYQVTLTPTTLGGDVSVYIWDIQADELATQWKLNNGYTIEGLRFNRPNGGIWAQLVASASASMTVSLDRSSFALHYDTEMVGDPGESSTGALDAQAAIAEADGQSTLTGTFSSTATIKLIDSEGNPVTNQGTTSGSLYGVQVTCPDPAAELVISQEEYLDAVSGG